VNELVGDAPKQHLRNFRHAPEADDDQVGANLLGLCQDLPLELPGFVPAGVRRVAGLVSS